MDARTSQSLHDQPLTLDELIQSRIDGLQEWLEQHAPECAEEQRHLDEGTDERTYWHYGYLTALRDMQNAVRKHRQN
jgi:hypothetical protein